MAWIILVAVAIVFAVLAIGLMIYLAVHLSRVEAGLHQAATLFNQLADSLDKLSTPLGNLARRAKKPRPPDHPETWDPELGCMTTAIATSAVYRPKTHATVHAPAPSAATKISLGFRKTHEVRKNQVLRRVGLRKTTAPKNRRGAMLPTRRKRRPMRRSKVSQMLSTSETAGKLSVLPTTADGSDGTLVPEPSLVIPPPPPPSQRKNILGSATVSFSAVDT